MPPRRKEHPMGRALQVVSKLMTLPHAQQLFNAPVDTEALGLSDYHDVIAHAMDLGSVRASLAEGEATGFATCDYSSPEHVLQAINLVWTNCIAYNTRPDEAAIADAARELSQVTVDLWRKAGLPCPGRPPADAPPPRSPLAEQAIIALYDRYVEQPAGAGAPIRTLDNFCIFAVQDGAAPALWSLDCLTRTFDAPPPGAAPWPTVLYAHGTLVPQTEHPTVRPREAVQVGPLLDWTVVTGPLVTTDAPHGSGGGGSVAARTEAAWYRLGAPAEAYADVFAKPQLYARTCRAALTVLAAAPQQPLAAFLLAVCKELMVKHGYRDQNLVKHLQGLLQHVRTWLTAWAAGITRPDAFRPNEASTSIDEAAELAAAGAVPAIAAQVQALETDTPAAAALMRDTMAAVEQMAHALPPAAPTPAPAPAATAGPAAEAPDARRAARPGLQRVKLTPDDGAAGARLAACELSRARARGPPPPPRSGWRTPPDRLPELLSLWDFLGTFAQALWLPPIPLVRLDAALCPNPAAASAADAASALVLRDVHCALMRTVEGRAGKGAPRPKGPVRASAFANALPCVGDHHWQVRMVKVLEARVYEPLLVHEPHALDAMAALRAADYLCLPLAQRFAILNVLMLLALQSPILRNEVGQRIERFHMLHAAEREEVARANKLRRMSKKQRESALASLPSSSSVGKLSRQSSGGTRVAGGSADGSERRGSDDEAEAEAASGDDGSDDGTPAASGSGAMDEADDASGHTAAAWWRYVQDVRCGLRRWLGEDALGRRMWLLAGRSGAFQIVVEPRPAVPAPDSGAPQRRPRDSPVARAAGASPAEPEWGVYHASDIYSFVAWLEAGGISAEAPLLASLRRMPLPLPHAAPATQGTPEAAAATAAKWRAAAPPPEAVALDTGIPDGYAGLTAPHLPGSLLQPHTISRVDPPPPVALVRGLHAALSSLLFWKRGHEDAGARAIADLLVQTEELLGPALDPAAPHEDAVTTQKLRDHTVGVEERLQARGGLVPAWAARAHAWRTTVKAAVSLPDVSLAAAALCQNVAWTRERVLHRGSFHNYTATQHVPLMFPVPGDRVMVVRAGLQAHLQRIRAAVLRPPLVRREAAAAAAAGAKHSRPAASDDVNAAASPSEGGGGGAEHARTEGSHSSAQRSEASPASSSAHASAPALGRAGGAQGEEPAAAAVSEAEAAREPPAPTPQQEAWLADLDWVEKQAEELPAVMGMTVAAVAYVAGEVPDFKSRDGFVYVARPPTQWLLLRPDGGKWPMVLPIHADGALPDYMVQEEAFEAGRARNWQPGDRFRMQFGGRKGSWYRGTVAALAAPEPSVPAEVIDPWEGLEVRWDDSQSSAVTRVSMWEIEVDPNSDEARIAEEKATMQRHHRRERSGKRIDERGASPPAYSADGDAGGAAYAPVLAAAAATAPAAEQPAAAAAAAAPAAKRPRNASYAAANRSELPQSAAVAAAAARATGGRLCGTRANPCFMPPVGDVRSPYYTGAIPSEVLQQLPRSEERFATMITNFHLGRGHPRFRVPSFAGVELSMLAVFNDVIQHGGCLSVTQRKKWRDVVRTLNLATTSSSTAMRQNYERTVRCFELYLRAGEFAADAAAGLLPPSDRVLTRAKQLELWQQLGGPHPRYEHFRPYPDFHAFGSEAEVAEAASRPAVSSAPPPEPPPASAAAAAAAGLPPPSAQAAVGRAVWRKWQGHGWYEAKIVAYNPAHARGVEHTLVYQQGTPQELVERMNVLLPPVPLCWHNPALRPPPPMAAATPAATTGAAGAVAAALQPATAARGAAGARPASAGSGAAGAVAATLQPGGVRPTSAHARPASALGPAAAGAAQVAALHGRQPSVTPAAASQQAAARPVLAAAAAATPVALKLGASGSGFGPQHDGRVVTDTDGITNAASATGVVNSTAAATTDVEMADPADDNGSEERAGPAASSKNGRT